MQIDPRIMSDTFAILREYTHHILATTNSTSRAWKPEKLNQNTAVESALADYFPASYLKEPRVGTITAQVIGYGPFLRNLENDTEFREFNPENDAPEEPYLISEAWSGAFWELRTRCGSQTIDPFLAEAWLRTKWNGDNLSQAQAFVKSLLAA
jgi:hypothetical protein